MAKSFDDKTIKNLKPKDKPYRVVEARGFCVRVLPSGTKSFGYRFTLYGKKQELSLGTYPEVTLAAAREKYQAAYTKLKNGIDPRHVEPTKDLMTFKHFADLYLTEYSKAHHSTSWQKTIKLSLENDVLPFWGNKDIKDIKRADGIALIELVIKRERPGQAANVHKAAMGVLGYALERGHLEYNVLVGLSKPVPALRLKRRVRVLTEAEIKHVWHALDDSSIGRALKLILVTAQRPGEVAGLHTQEFQVGEGKLLCKTCRGCKNYWTIPQARAEKGKGDHLVYLTTTAVNLTRSIDDMQGLVFDVKRNSLSQYLSRDKNYLDLPRWTPHDLRRTARTFMAKIGIINEHAEAVIAHKKPGIVAAYNQWDYKEEKEQALIKWEAELLRIVS
jgi:integrase